MLLANRSKPEMEAVTAYLAMGGYGAFVWPAYGIAVLAMLGVLFASLRAVRVREAELEQLQKMRPNRARRRDAAPAQATPEKQAS
jgi:heme exporter protein D